MKIEFMFSYVIGINEEFKTETWNQFPTYTNERYIKQMLHIQNKEAYKVCLGNITTITSRKIT